MTESKEQSDRQVDIEPFLEELKALYSKHGIMVVSCSCCGNCWLEECDAKDVAVEQERLLKRGFDRWAY